MISACLLTPLSPGETQAPATPPDLPLPPWGFASRQSMAPTFMGARARNRLFVFPIIVGQKRTEVAFSPFNKGGVERPGRVALIRRSVGMSLPGAERDDREALSVRSWRIKEADTHLSLTRFTCEFAAVSPVQRILTGGKPVPDWTPGKAELTLYPGNAEPAAEGLIVAVKLTNDSDEAQTYFVDTLTMLESETPDLSDSGKLISTEGSTLTLQHNDAKLSFALLSDNTQFSRRAYRVTSAYFAEKSNLEPLLASGGSSPVGALSPELGAGDKPNWGLLRVDNIAVAPHNSQTVRLCIGVGKSTGEAQGAASVLLGYASDTLANGKKRETPGLFSLAQSAHRDAQKTTGSLLFDDFLNRTYVTIPLNDGGRAGTPGRILMPTAFSCASIATGWATAQPELATSEAVIGLSLLSDLPLDRRGEGLLTLLTSLDALPLDVRRAVSLTRHYSEISGAAKSLMSPLPFLVNVLMERFALETNAESSESLRWRAAKEKGATLYLASLSQQNLLTAATISALSNAEFARKWNGWLEQQNPAFVLAEGKRRLLQVEKEAQTKSGSLETVALLPLYFLLNTPGTVRAGNTISMINTDYDAGKDTLKFSFRPFLKGAKGQIFCRMGKPNTLYRLTGATLPEAKTDENGVLTFPLSGDTITQVVEAVPSP